jgi:CcmD family protein
VLNTYLFLAYSLVWLIFILYAWNLSRRQENLKKELEDLKARIQIPKP